MISTIVTLKKGEGRTIKSGGAWIYDNEIDKITGRFRNGDVVIVHDFDGYPMGCGFINQNSKIRIRMLSRRTSELSFEFIYNRTKAAWEYRKAVMLSANPENVDGCGRLCNKDINCCRLIFGEADFLPGLVVDKYNDVLVVECLALGMERLKRTVLYSLINLLRDDGIEIKAVYEKSDAVVRKKEGLEIFKGILPLKWIEGYDENAFDEEISTKVGQIEFADLITPEELVRVNNPIEIVENGVHYLVDVVNGQKTGFFLDQKYNRLAMQNLCKNLANNNNSLKVLDCFTHMGTFALNCGIAGAADVTGLDISEFAVSQATKNAELNGLSDTVHFRQANVLDELPKLAADGEKYDVVILDPPAFTKSREATKNAIKGYREINMKGLKLVKDGGYFASCSCSHFMTQELLSDVISQAAKAVHRRVRQIEFRTQASDHPILWAAEESFYLKFFIFQVVDEK